MSSAGVKIRYRKSFSFVLALVGAFLVSLAAFLRFPFLEDVESRTVDLRFHVQGERRPKTPIVIVAIDNASLEKIGRWPWPRAVHARLVDRLQRAGAKFIFLDIFYAEPEQDPLKPFLMQLERWRDTVSKEELRKDGEKPTAAVDDSFRREWEKWIRTFQNMESGDARLAKAIRRAGNVFLPLVPLLDDKGAVPTPESLNAAFLSGEGVQRLLTARSWIFSRPEIQKSALDSGHIRLFPDADGIYRHFPVAVRYEEYAVPHIALQLARHVLGAEKTPLRLADGGRTLRMGERNIPLQSRYGMVFIDYLGGKETFPIVSAGEVLQDDPPKILNGAIVLVGATADGLFDLRPTPFTRANPGVVVNATILENFLTGRFKAVAPMWVKLAAIFILAFLPWLWVPRVSPLRGSFFFIGTGAAWWVFGTLAFTRGAMVLPLTAPFLALVVSYGLLTVYKLRTEVRHSRYLKQMFQSMVAPRVVEEILKLPSGIELGGEEKEITVLFSDIRGFTTYSEKHAPQEVVEILNEYLTQMTQLIFQTEGTLDKYIGDAIMAFWGAPAAQQDHTYRACSTALGMVDLLHHLLHPKWELEGREKFEIGVGINTGPMVVGFVGSEHVKNYTLIGDNVNLASRLEGVTKEYRVSIVVSEAVQEKVKGDLLCRELDLIRVKGKDRPIRIYELVDHRLKAAGARETKIRLFEEGLQSYRNQDWGSARKTFRSVLEIDPKDGPAQVFLTRIEELSECLLPPDWDGVYTMKTK